MKPRVFIGSSVEGLPVANALQVNLDYDAEVTLWSQDVFKPSQFALESLITKTKSADFGIFVFSADDITKMRGEDHATARDNVVFELGLWIGHLGRERCIIVAQKDEPMHLPSDLLGINILSYTNNRGDGNWEAALGLASSRIRNLLKSMVKDDYGIKITSIKDGDIVTPKFMVTGTFTKEPPVDSIKAIIVNDKYNEYWPKNSIIIDPHTKEWHTEVSIGGYKASDNNENRTLIIAELGEHAKVLVNLQQKAGNERKTWIGLKYSHTLKEDIQRLAQVKIKIKEP